MMLREARSVQAQPASDETDLRRYIYQIDDLSGFFRRMKSTFIELEDEEKDEIQELLDSDHLDTSEEGIDLFWPQTGREFPVPVLCSVYLTPYGVCLDIMSDDPGSKARELFESFLDPEDLLESASFIPEDIMELRMMESDFEDEESLSDD